LCARSNHVSRALPNLPPRGISIGSSVFAGLTTKQDKGSPYSITERRVSELIPVLGSQHAGDVSHKPGGRLPLLSARPAVTPATLKRPATGFRCLVNRGTMGVNSLPKTVTDSVAARVLLRTLPLGHRDTKRVLCGND